MNIIQKSSFIRQLRNLHTFITNMCVHTDITDTEHHIRHGLRDGYCSIKLQYLIA